MRLKYLLGIIFLLVISSCSKSLVYSPSVNLPNKPLLKGMFQFQGGVAALPEGRPEAYNQNTAFGAEGTLRYAVSDYFTMQVKGWADLSNKVSYTRWGLSYANIIAFNNIEAKVIYGTMPTFAFLFDNEGLEAGGMSLPILFWIPQSHKSSLYFALGPGVGIRNITGNSNEWGWGIQGNIGYVHNFSDVLSVNIEFANIYQINRSEDVSHFIFSPSLNFGLVF